ncbi:MAG: hypothetical protein NTZ53_06615 [Cyanobacteria bacterium]|nr:hypothetical protein [Cyanobacteriota bacterium]
MASLSLEQLEDLQSFLKDWLRHSGRTQSDLRRALRVSSIRMPVLLEELERIHGREGLNGLAERLCGIDLLWQEQEATGDGDDLPDLEASLGQLDLLLEEIRQGGSGSAAN